MFSNNTCDPWILSFTNASHLIPPRAPFSLFGAFFSFLIYRAGVATLTFQYIFRLQHDTFAHKDEVEESEHPADFSQDPKSEDVEEGGEKAE